MANPDKPRPIQDILLRNKEKLVEFLTKFHTDRSEDEQFNDEKAYLIKQIKDMKPLDEGVAAATSIKPAEDHWEDWIDVSLIRNFIESRRFQIDKFVNLDNTRRSFASQVIYDFLMHCCDRDA